MKQKKKSMKILVVDDDILVRDVIKRALLSAGYDIVESSDGADALAQLEGGQFDLVVTDNIMPQGGVMPIANYIRNHNPSLPVLVVSGGMDQKSKNALAAAGIATQNILYKPFKKQELIETVERLLAKA